LIDVWLLIDEVSTRISLKATHHSRYDFSGQVISSSQRPLPGKHTTLTKDRNPCPTVEFEPKISAGERP